MTRRLAAIMFTDIAGFTTLTQSDEAGALRLLQEQQELVQPVLECHRGRQVKSIGDGLLIEFPDALDAVRCAADLQQQIHERNARGGTHALLLRVGIHLGDVQEEGADILGDSVNIASRVEPLAEPGGVCVSFPVYDQVHNKLPFSMEKLGPRSLKGVREPVEIYRVVFPWSGPIEPGAPVLPRIAVLPLVNISPDPNDEYFADGLTEELISVLSQISGLRVIARTSVGQYKGTAKPITRIGSELGVSSVIEGSVRKAGSQLRITLQLIDVASQEHVWSQSYERELDDVFAVQAGIARGVAESLKLQLLPHGRKRAEQPPSSNPEAYALYLKGQVTFNRARTEEDVARALGFFREALGKDPWYVAAHVGMARAFHWQADLGIKDALSHCRDSVATALQLDPSYAESHLEMGEYWVHVCEWDNAEREVRQALDLNPNLAHAYREYTDILEATGRLEEAVRQGRQALELDPLDARSSFNLARVYVRAKQIDEAIFHLRNAIEIDPERRSCRVWLGIAYVKKGLIDQGLAEIREANSGVKRPEYLAHLAWACLKAGKTDEVASILVKLEALRRGEMGAFACAIAGVHAMLGHTDKAFEWLESGRQDPSGLWPYALLQDWFESLWQDPRFIEILQSMGLKLSGSTTA